MFAEHDHYYMQRALQLAEKALYLSTPNPRVGCVIVRDGQVLGEGYTQAAGGNHAEVQALNDAQRRGHRLSGTTVYVTLEPCSHFGRTPPCVGSLISAGVSTVIAAMEDPNPLVSGKGLQTLRQAGIEVRCGLLQDQACALNLGFIARMTRGRPWIRLKSAASLDGRTALHNGTSKWITSQSARDDNHHWRARACAILTGIGTVLSDDPQMNVRALSTLRQPRKFILDSHLRIPETARILQGAPTTVFVLPYVIQASSAKVESLQTRGIEMIAIEPSEAQPLQLDINHVIKTLSSYALNEIHVESGSRLNSRLLQGHYIDELLLYLAPSLLGDAIGLFDNDTSALTDLSHATRLKFIEAVLIGTDLRVRAKYLNQELVSSTSATGWPQFH